MATTCLVSGCHKIVKKGRCARHQQPIDRERNQRKNAQPHRQQGRNHTSATKEAERTGARCDLCGRHEQPAVSRNSNWHWHHVTPGDVTSRQALTHAWCNSSYGSGERYESAAHWLADQIELGKIYSQGSHTR